MEDKTKTLNRRPRIKGICADAQALGVHRVHLHKVVRGDRQSKRLLRRYNELQKQKTHKLKETQV